MKKYIVTKKWFGGPEVGEVIERKAEDIHPSIRPNLQPVSNAGADNADEVAKLKGEIDKLKKDHADDIKKLKADHKAEIDKLKK